MKKASIKFLYLLIILSGCSKTNEPAPFQPLVMSKTVYQSADNGSYSLISRTDYSYTNGKLAKEQFSPYDALSSSFIPFSVSDYFYDQGNVKTIEKTLVDPNIKTITSYQYDGDRLTSIVSGEESGIEAKFIYLAGDSIEVTYTGSNGRWTRSLLAMKDHNVIFLRSTSDDSQTKSESVFEFDHYKNPLQLFGFTDLFLLNYSANNPVSVDTRYFAGQVPNVIPFSYSYEYNAFGYPTVQITSLRHSSNMNFVGSTKTVFEYTNLPAYGNSNIMIHSGK